MQQERRTERYETLNNDHFSADYINMAPLLCKKVNIQKQKRKRNIRTICSEDKKIK